MLIFIYSPEAIDPIYLRGSGTDNILGGGGTHEVMIHHLKIGQLICLKQTYFNRCSYQSYRFMYFVSDNAEESLVFYQAPGSCLDELFLVSKRIYNYP